MRCMRTKSQPTPKAMQRPPPGGGCLRSRLGEKAQRKTGLTPCREYNSRCTIVCGKCAAAVFAVLLDLPPAAQDSKA